MKRVAPATVFEGASERRTRGLGHAPLEVEREFVQHALGIGPADLARFVVDGDRAVVPVAAAAARRATAPTAVARAPWMVQRNFRRCESR